MRADRTCAGAAVLAVFCVPLAVSALAYPPIPPPNLITVSKDTNMTYRASGTFEVKLTPQANDSSGDTSLGRMLIDKQFDGDLKAISKGQMLSAMTAVKGSAGYGAIVVDFSSAIEGCFEPPEAVAAEHRQLGKPRGTDTPAYMVLRDKYRRELYRADPVELGGARHGRAEESGPHP